VLLLLLLLVESRTSARRTGWDPIRSKRASDVNDAARPTVVFGSALVLQVQNQK
jgi:hypothetical protein